MSAELPRPEPLVGPRENDENRPPHTSWEDKAALVGLQPSDSDLLEKLVAQIKANRRGITIPRYPRIVNSAEPTTKLVIGNYSPKLGTKLRVKFKTY